MRAWLGIDTGGTFTDLVLVDAASGTQWLHKTPTTPEDASRGILDGISQILQMALIAPNDVALICHGTTLATNAVLQRKWARTGMLTTAGFRDVIELARQRRPSFFNLNSEKPAPPASRDLRLELRERVAHDGAVVTPLDLSEVRAAVQRLRDLGAEAVSICLLHSYANPSHERQIAEIVRELWPEAFICASSDILAEFREYERFATTTVNASLMPVIDRYLDRFERGVAALDIKTEPRIMQSNGGAVSTTTVRQAPINTFFSGPAGGVIGSVGIGASVGVKDIITFDMGGTSTDVALIRNARPSQHNVREMGGFPVRTRTLDIHSIGAGGGSLAWVDPGGLLKVGPQSAGAVPGPACYGRGGERPTVTDANMVLGRLNPKALLNGRMPVYPDKGRAAIESHLCETLDLDLVRAASGIIEIVNVNMKGALRVISVERGEDPRDCALMAFGGAGPLHAAAVAIMMEMPRVLVPTRPGLLSAMGLLQADARADFSLTRLLIAEAAALGSLNAGLAELEQRGARWLTQEGGSGSSLREWQADLRYFGQNFELSAALPGAHLDTAELDEVLTCFHAAHKMAYGYDMPERKVEIVNLRLAVIVPQHVPPREVRRRSGSLANAVAGEREVWFADTGFVTTPVYDREEFPAEGTLTGPAIIEQMDTTTVVPPRAVVVIEPTGDLILHLPISSEASSS